MALTKRTYTDGETVITAQNLNDIQDEVRGNIRNVSYNTTSGKIQKTTNSGTSSDVVTVDATPTQNSKNPVQSGGVYTKINELSGTVSDKILYFSVQNVSAATNAEILRITDSRINATTVVLEWQVVAPDNIKSSVNWTSAEGYISFVGTCSSATTANVTLGNR